MEKLSAMEKECDSLQEERSGIEKKMSIASKTEVNPIIIEKKGIDTEALEKRGQAIKEGRTITVASDEILLPNM